MGYLVFERFPSFQAEWRARLGLSKSNDPKRADVKQSQLLDNIFAGIVAVLAVVTMWPFYTTRMIPEQDGKIYSGGSCWADLPIHMHIAESFLQGRNQDVSWGDMHSPVFAGERMYYPFIPDWHAAVLVKMGATMRQAFLYPGTSARL